MVTRLNPAIRLSPLACILPPDLLATLAHDGTLEQRTAVLDTLQLDHSFRLARAEAAVRLGGRPPQAAAAAAGGGSPQRTIYDQQHSTAYTPGTLKRSEGGPAVADVSINQAYDNFGATYPAAVDASVERYGATPVEPENPYWQRIGAVALRDPDGFLVVLVPGPWT